MFIQAGRDFSYHPFLLKVNNHFTCAYVCSYVCVCTRVVHVCAGMHDHMQD